MIRFLRRGRTALLQPRSRISLRVPPRHLGFICKNITQGLHPGQARFVRAWLERAYAAKSLLFETHLKDRINPIAQLALRYTNCVEG
jgi:hypothetical protein